MEKNSNSKSLWKKLISSREVSLLTVLIIICVAVQLRNNAFLTPKTINDLLKNYSTTLVMSLGMMSVLLIGGIDISVGATLAFSGMCASLLMRDGVYSSTLLMFLVSTAIGTCCGALVGLVIAKGKVQPIIATLGFSNIFRGATYIVSGGAWVSAYQFQRPFKKFAQQSSLTFGAINNMVFIVLVCYIAFFLIMKWTRFGRRIYAVGSNPEAAAVSGINIDKYKFIVYTMMAIRIMAPLIAICQNSEIPTSGNALLITAIVKAPSNTPTTDPCPPERLTPPSTQEAIASISIPVPISLIAEA